KGMATLYEDPTRTEPLVISGCSIGMKMMPEKWNFSDPVFVRHILCLMIVIHGIFHAILCCCQLRLVEKSKEPPPQMEGIMSLDDFKDSKDKQLHRVQLALFNVCADTIYSCLDLYLCTLAIIWKLTVEWYRFASDIWLNVVFMTIFTTYLVIRRLPSMFYEKLILDPKYNVDPKKSWPLIGVMCSLAFFVVFMQIGVIPLTAICMTLAKLKVWYFVLVCWLFLLAVDFILHLATGIFGVPCLGKSRLLKESEMSKQLSVVLQTFKYPGRVYLVHTYYLGRPTALVLGACCCRRLAIHDNLMLNKNVATDDLPSTQVGAGLNDVQLAAFVAHQLAHWRLWHIPKSLLIFHLTLLTYLVIFGFSYNWQTMYLAAGFTRVYPYVVGYWLVYKYLMTLYRTGCIWIVYYFLRHFEYTADRYCYRLGVATSMKAALLKLFADHRVFPYVHFGYLMWYRHKPSILQRIRNIQRLENKDEDSYR
ncbi:hypothetical protein KR059_011693, partial [Drosophila kikkawai]